jgi:ATP dependent DNA ligase domain
MLLKRKERLPEGADWLYEIKLDGYRALAIKNDGGVALRSRNDNDFSRRYPTIVKALTALPDETVVTARLLLSMKRASRGLMSSRITARRHRPSSTMRSMCSCSGAAMS